MRIDAFNKVNQLYQTSKPRKVGGKSAEDKRDSLELSQAGKEFQIAKAAVKAAPDVRQDRVDAIKQKLANGTYSVTGEDIADKLVESFFDQKI